MRRRSRFPAQVTSESFRSPQPSGSRCGHFCKTNGRKNGNWRVMMASQGEDLVRLYDGPPLNARYWASIALGMASSIFDYFDFYIVGFLVAVLAPQWHLTFGQTSLMLLSAGIGAIIGSLVWGALADRFGRKK